MSKESSTEFISKYPLLKAVLDYCFKRLEVIVLLSLTSVGLTIYQHHQNHSQIWQETGNHFQDVVQTLNTNVLPRLEALEKERK